MRTALEYLPDLFDEDGQIKPPFIKKINGEIKMFFRQKQLKISRKSQADRKDALPYSLYFLKNERTGDFHYFVSPRKKTRSLGKGGEGYAVPLYELIREDITYTLTSQAVPALILKFFDKKLTFAYTESDTALLRFELQKRQWEKKPDPKVNSICYEQEEQFISALWTQKSPALFSQHKNYASMSQALHLAQPYFPGEDGIEFYNHYGELLHNPEAYFAHFIQGIKFSIAAAKKLKALHDEGFLHCDLKLENMILCPDGSLKLIDTRKSRKISEPQALDGGTPHYASKEQLDSGHCTVESEIYSLGVCCYALLGGQDLFRKLKSSPECSKEELSSLKKSPLRKAHQKRSPRVDKNFLSNLNIDMDLKSRIRNLIENLLSDEPHLRKKLDLVICELDIIQGFIEGPDPRRTPSPLAH